MRLIISCGGQSVLDAHASSHRPPAYPAALSSAITARVAGGLDRVDTRLAPAGSRCGGCSARWGNASHASLTAPEPSRGRRPRLPLARLAQEGRERFHNQRSIPIIMYNRPAKTYVLTARLWKLPRLESRIPLEQPRVERVAPPVGTSNRGQRGFPRRVVSCRSAGVDLVPRKGRAGCRARLW